MLKAAKGLKLAVAGHMRPDGDCVASQFALAEILRSAGADVVCINRDPVPFLYKNFSGETFAGADDFDEPRQIALVDCSDFSRASPALASRYSEVFACVDHHASGNSSARFKIVDIEAGATAEAK